MAPLLGRRPEMRAESFGSPNCVPPETKWRQETMTDTPVDLDEHRGMASQKATEVRRDRFDQFQEDQAISRFRQEELEKLLQAAPAETWPEAAEKAEYLIQLFADGVY